MDHGIFRIRTSIPFSPLQQICQAGRVSVAEVVGVEDCRAEHTDGIGGHLGCHGVGEARVIRHFAKGIDVDHLPVEGEDDRAVSEEGDGELSGRFPPIFSCSESRCSDKIL